MSNEIVNNAQAELWENAGPFWLEEQKRFDERVDVHGLRAIAAVDPSPGESVLDIGCGTGSSAFQIATRLGPSGSVVGADISGSMVSAAKSRAAAAGVSNVSFVRADAQVHTFDQPFDLVFSRFGIMFFEDPPAAFANIHRTLKPTGRIGFACWQSPMKNSWVGAPLEAINRILPVPFGADPDAPGPFSLANPDKVRDLLTGAGFSSVELAPNEAKVPMGASVDDAAAFLLRLLPPTAGLSESDPPLAQKALEAIRGALQPFDGPDGVLIDSATWIVTAQA